VRIEEQKWRGYWGENMFIDKILSRKFIKRLRKASPREVVALLSIINMNGKVMEKLLKKVKASGYKVVEDERLEGKMLVIKSLLPNQRPEDFIDPELRDLFISEIRSRGDDAVNDLIKTIKVNPVTIPILSSLLNGYTILPNAIYQNLKELDDERYVKKLEDERNGSLVERIFGKKSKAEERMVENCADFIDPPNELVKVAEKLDLFPFGSLSYYEIPSFLFWHSEKRVIIEVFKFNDVYGVRGSKYFFVTDVEDFKSDIRDIGAFTDYLKNKVKEFRLHTFFINRITPSMVPFMKRTTMYEMEKTRKELDEERRKLRHLQIGMIYSYNPYEKRELKRWINERKHRIKSLEKVYRNLKKDYETQFSLMKEWKEKGVAIAFIISIGSTIYLTPYKDLPQAIEFVISDLETETKAIKPRASQKHHLFLEDLPFPPLAFSTELVGLSDPNKLREWTARYPKVQELSEMTEQMFLPRLSQDIQIGGKKIEKSDEPAIAIQSILRRCYEYFGKTKPRIIEIPLPSMDKIPSQGLFLGSIVGNDFKDTDKVAFLKAEDLRMHLMITGATGSGKTTCGKFIVKEIAEKSKVIILDPTGSWKNLIKAEVLKPESLDYLTLIREENGIVIIDFSELSEENKMNFANDILNELYSGLPKEETKELKLSILIDDLHRFLPGIGEILEKCARDLRKYGVGFILISHVIPDLKAIRANVNMRIHMRTNYEPDIERVAREYGSHYSRIMNKLPVGIGLFYFHGYNEGKPYFIHFGHAPKGRISEQERALLALIESMGEPNIRQAQEKSGFGWKKFYKIINNLVRKGYLEIVSEGARKKKLVSKKNYVNISSI